MEKKYPIVKADKLEEHLSFRQATKEDVYDIVKMLADDELGKKRENFTTPLPDVYYAAFNRIDQDPNQELIVVVENDSIIGTLQLSFIPYLTYQGGTRAQIEAVRIRKDRRGLGLGQRMFEWAINRAKAKGAHLLQLTVDKQRLESRRFYHKLGVRASHDGMKLHFS